MKRILIAGGVFAVVVSRCCRMASARGRCAAAAAAAAVPPPVTVPEIPFDSNADFLKYSPT